jgi:AcrR family transcriptional regulator
MVYTVAEHGFARTKISDVCIQARVSPGTFYDCFDNLQDCFAVVIDEGYRRVHALISLAFQEQNHWLEGIRAALASLFTLFDDEPLLARVWFVETLAAGSWALERRDRHLASLTAMISRRWPIPQGVSAHPLTPRAVIESILGLIHTRLLAAKDEPLVTLLGPVMGLIGAVYLGEPAAATEIERGEAYASAIIAVRQTRADSNTEDVDIPRALRDPRAHRARLCMHYLANNSGASNREIAGAVGIAHQEQISKLLARLNALGLLDKRPAPPGGANAWSLTHYGEKITQRLLAEHI